MTTSLAIVSRCVGWLGAAIIAGQAIASPSSRLVTYEHNGQTSYAASLSADAQAVESPQVDLVVMFDTSASQQGAYRDKAIAALESLIGNLRQADRVAVMAVDLEADAMTDGWVAPGSDAAKSAIQKIRQRAPLGSTDMPGVCRAAVEQFDGDGSRQRAIVYIGDGSSMANLLDAEALRNVTDLLRHARASLNSYAVGPQVDSQRLAVLANHTGGNLRVADPPVYQSDEVAAERADQENVRNGSAAGELLARWSRATVLWPESVQFDPRLGKVYPAAMPPLRSDRDAILIGRTSDATDAPMEVRLSAAGPQGRVELDWTLEAEPSHADLAFLEELVEAASANDGLTLPTLGTAGLAETARLMGAEVDQLTMIAERAVAAGDRESAAQIAQAVLRRDPGNTQARLVQNAAAQPAETEELPPVSEPDAPVAGADVVASPDEIILIQDDPAADLQPRGGAFLDEVAQEREVYAGLLTTDVQNTVIDAREMMATNPDLAIQELKLTLQNVQRAVDLEASKRAELTDKLRVALREAERQATIKDELDRQREQTLAAARERAFLEERLAQRIAREDQLMEQFSALMDETRYAEAEEVAAIVEEIDPDGVTPRAATLWSRDKRRDYLLMATRAAKHNAFWDTMFQVNLSHVPFPDSPPIVYPDAPVWEELSNRRIERWGQQMDTASDSESEQRIREALREPLIAPMDYIGQPLSDVVRQIELDYEIPIIIDTAALDVAVISPDREIDLQISNVTLRSALELMLEQIEDLTYIIENEVLMITTTTEAETKLRTKVYPVADLVIPVTQLGGIGGGIGGGGGGFGGGGGGFGGGGFGGGGGGFGGGGGGFGGGGGGFGGGGGGFGGGGGGFGGGGGGGFFAVPDDVAQPVATETQAGSSSEATADAKATTESNENSSNSVDAEAVRSTAPHVRGIEIDASMDADAFWSQHFAAKREDPKVVRNAVRMLMKQGHPDHVAALIMAALRHGQPQSWMYQSLAVAMELDGRPKREIERAVMSACDFSTDPSELMLIARYLTSIDLDARAVSVYRQVAKASHLHQEAYALGLRAAQRAGDVEGIRWATIGILKQAWPADQAAVRNTAVRVAKATLDELREQGETEVADQYERELSEALIRDCVVEVSWSGEADVDVIVEEPTGTVCSFRNDRTPGGGVCLGDSYANFENSASGGFKETYICPEGFAGEYRVRIRKVWGEPVAGKVVVDVYKNYRTDDQKHQRQYIEVGDDDAMVVFNLENGRRNEPIEQLQLASAIDRQEALDRALLAQQIRSLSDESIVPDRDDVPFPFSLRRQLALARGGQVGFMPVIQVLPEGTQFIAQAVVSHDRRYVRISASPSFTGIGNVTTFTFAGAGEPVEEEDNGGNGGNGGDGGNGG